MIRSSAAAGVVVLTALSLALPGIAQEVQPVRTIAVTVNQTVPLVPDTAVFELRLSPRTLRSPDEVALAISQAGILANLSRVQSFCQNGCSGRGSAIYPSFVFRLQRDFSQLASVFQFLESNRTPLSTSLDLVDYRYSLVSVEYSDAQVNQAEIQVRVSLEAAARRRAESLASAAGLRLGAALARSASPAGNPAAWFNTSVFSVPTVISGSSSFASFLIGYASNSAISGSSNGDPGVAFALSVTYAAE